MIQMMANMAEFERRRMGERMKDALAALKANGVKLGTPANLTNEHRLKGARIAGQRSKAKAIEHCKDIAEIALPMRQAGATFAKIAQHLNANEYVSPKGKAWSATAVLRVLARMTAKP